MRGGGPPNFRICLGHSIQAQLRALDLLKNHGQFGKTVPSFGPKRFPLCLVPFYFCIHSPRDLPLVLRIRKTRLAMKNDSFSDHRVFLKFFPNAAAHPTSISPAGRVAESTRDLVELPLIWQHWLIACTRATLRPRGCADNPSAVCGKRLQRPQQRQRLQQQPQQQRGIIITITTVIFIILLPGITAAALT